MRKQVFGALLVLVVILSLLWSAPARAAEPAPYVIGLAYDLTGFAAIWNLPQKRGMEYGLDKINAAGGVNGRKLKTIIYDSQSIPTEPLKIAKKLIEVDKVTMLSGFCNLMSVAAVFPLVGEAKVPFISGALCLSADTPPPNPWSFTVVPDVKISSGPIITNILIDQGCKKIALIYTDFVIGQMQRKLFEETMQKRGLTPAAIEKYPLNAVEMDTQVARIKASGADGLVVSGATADSVKIIRTAHGVGFTGKIVCDTGSSSPEFVTLGGKDVEGVVNTATKAIVAHDLADKDPQKKIAVDLYDFYTKKYGSMDPYSANGWDAIMIIAEALKKVDPKLDPSRPADVPKIRSQVRDAVEQIKGFVGQNGIFNYSPTNHVGLKEGCFVPIVVKDGRWTLYQQ